MTVFDKAKEKKSVAADSRKNARPPWPPLRGGSARRRWGREPCGGQEYFGSRLAKNACSSPLKLKLHLFRQVCRGRIYASRAGYPLYRMIGTAAAGGIYAAPTSQPILFILVYGRGRGMPRPYTCNRGKTHPHPPPLQKKVGADSISASARLRQVKLPRAHIECAALSWPPLRGGSARRRWGREPCGSPEYFGSWQGSLPPPLRGTSLAEGGQTRTPTDLAFDITLAGSARYNKKRVCDILYVTDSWCAVQDSNL